MLLAVRGAGQHVSYTTCSGCVKPQCPSSEMTPAKGQLVYMPPDPDVDYLTLGGGSSNLYMFSRSDDLLLDTLIWRSTRPLVGAGVLIENPQ